MAKQDVRIDCRLCVQHKHNALPTQVQTSTQMRIGLFVPPALTTPQRIDDTHAQYVHALTFY